MWQSSSGKSVRPSQSHPHLNNCMTQLELQNYETKLYLKTKFLKKMAIKAHKEYNT